jgi:hypothetical protein
VKFAAPMIYSCFYMKFDNTELGSLSSSAPGLVLTH